MTLAEGLPWCGGKRPNENRQRSDCEEVDMASLNCAHPEFAVKDCGGCAYHYFALLFISAVPVYVSGRGVFVNR
jgi:hypothetical protein